MSLIWFTALITGLNVGYDLLDVLGESGLTHAGETDGNKEKFIDIAHSLLC